MPYLPEKEVSLHIELKCCDEYCQWHKKIIMNTYENTREGKILFLITY